MGSVTSLSLVELPSCVVVQEIHLGRVGSALGMQGATARAAALVLRRFKT